MEDFKVMMKIANAFQKNVGDTQHMFIRGLASGLNVDLQDDRLVKTAVDALSKAIDEGIVLPNGTWSLIPLRSGHRLEWDDILGWITKAEIDDDYNLWIEAELDPTSTVARDLFVKLNQGDRPGRPLQLGLSIGGKIKRATFEWNHDLQKRIRVIEDLLLKEVSVVGSPANPATYVEALAKSVNWEDVPPPVEELLLKKEPSMSDTNETVTQTESTETVVAPAETVATTTDPAAVDASTSTVEAEVVPSAEEVSETDPNANTQPAADLSALQSQVGQLQDAITQLQTAVANFASSQVQKAEETVTEASTEDNSVDVAKSLSDSLDSKIVAAVEAAFNKLKQDILDPLTSDITVVKSVVEDLGKQPNDQSLSVRKAKEEQETVQTFNERLEKSRNTPGFNPIRDAIQTSLAARA